MSTQCYRMLFTGAVSMTPDMVFITCIVDLSARSGHPVPQ